MDERYENVRRVPSDRLKPIGAGKLAKMTDINAQWRIEVMTETYGLCGLGWKYEIGEAVHQPMNDGQIMLYLPVSVYIKDKETNEWSAPITQYGGDWLIKKEKEKLVGQEEAYKKCLTDALGKALSVIGVAGDVYAGCWDGAKYTDKTLLVDEDNDDTGKKPESLRQAEAMFGGETQIINVRKDDNGYTLVRHDNGKWYALEAMEKQGKLESLNTLLNDKRYEEAHAEIRMRMARMAV